MHRSFAPECGQGGNCLGLVVIIIQPAIILKGMWISFSLF